MIYEKIDNMITQTMTLVGNLKKREDVSPQDIADATRLLNLQREVKTEMTKATKGDEKNPGIQLPNDEAELAILDTMYRKRKAALKEFFKAAGDPLAQEAIETNKYEMQWLEQFLPKMTSEEDVRNESMCVIKTFVELKSMADPSFNPKMLQRFTRDIIAKVKEKYPDADNAIIAGCIQEYNKS